MKIRYSKNEEIFPLKLARFDVKGMKKTHFHKSFKCFFLEIGGAHSQNEQKQKSLHTIRMNSEDLQAVFFYPLQLKWNAFSQSKHIIIN